MRIINIFKKENRELVASIPIGNDESEIIIDDEYDYSLHEEDEPMFQEME